MADTSTNQPNKNNQFFITIKRGLLEDKHRQAMQINQKTTAVWMYIWLIDKITSIDADTKLGTVLHGKPLKIDALAKELYTSRNTANKMLQTLKNHGYIETVRTPHGNIVYVTKAFKIFGQKIPSDNKLQFVESYGAEHTVSTKSNTSLKKPNEKSNTSKQESNTSLSKNRKNLIRHSKQGLPLKESNTSNITRHIQDSSNNSNSTNVELGDQQSPDGKEQIKKLYYDCIKVYKLPVLNHNTLRAKINAMCREDEPEAIIKYLTFMRDQYQRVEMSYKPRIANALDFYTKRIQIKEAITDEVKSQQTSRSWRPKSKGVGK